jgi:hypothetical protein
LGTTYNGGVTMSKIRTKGTACVLIYVRVPVIRTEITDFDTPNGKETKCDFKLLKSKVRFNLTKNDLFEAFNNTHETDLNATFEESK